MCGICGFATTDPARALSEETLLAMRETLAHRGPDDAGVHVDQMCGFAHRRLSIVDLEGGHQPMSNEDGTVWIVHNGEIYNHAELRPELESAGHRYASRSDTETLIHLYEQHGGELVHRLRGMFAFAVWDACAKRLLLVRDRLGIKPLYYTIDGSRILFASEIKALLASGVVEPRLNYDALPEFLALGYNVGETTLYRGVKRLPPGNRLVWQNGSVNIEQYWDLKYPAQPLQISEGEAVERFTELLTESVRLRLMSDVPLGVFLSGGIDSSAIAALMARLAGGRISTFSVGFAERDYSEFHFARQVAEAIDAEHHEITIKPADFFENLPMLIRHEDEPIRWPSSVALYFVSKLAREHVKVVLTGEGSDELLGGYAKYWAGVQNTRFAKTLGLLVPQPVRRMMARHVWKLPAPMKLKKLLSHSFLCRSSRPADLLFDNFYGIFNRDLQDLLLAPAAKTDARLDSVDPWAATVKFFNESGATSLLDRMLYADIKTYLVELLMKQDQMSMAASSCAAKRANMFCAAR